MDQSPGAPAPLPRQVTRGQVFSWQLYDFADTIYAMNVLSRYFGPWIIRAFGATALTYNLLATMANLVVALTSPALGALSDSTQRRLPYLRMFAMGCAAATATLGFSRSLPVAIILFLISYCCYSWAGTFYQALLPGLGTARNISRISGVGVALGYVGAIAGLLLVMPFADDAHLERTFLPTALLFLFFAVPGLVNVPDFAPPVRRVSLDLLAGYRAVANTIRHSARHKYLFRFLIADFIYENAVAAVIANMAVYSEIVVGFRGMNLTFFLIGSTAFAIIFSWVYGHFTDRVGPKPAVMGMLAIWLVVFPLVVITTSRVGFYFLGPLAGMGLGATWVSSRTYLIALSPVAKSGEFFGLYALSGKSAGVLGLAFWSAVLWLLQPYLGEAGALQAAAGAMVIFVLIGLALVRTLPAVRPGKENVLCE